MTLDKIKQSVSRTFSRASVIFIVLLISGCSTFSFVFERLDWFTAWRLDSMFDLTDEQEDKLKPDILALQKWIRTEGFPETIEKLKVLLTHWENDEPELAYRHLTRSMQSLNSLYLNASKEGVVRFSMALSEKNARQYREYSEDKQEDWFESVQSIDERIEHEIERLETWFGRLTDQQENLIESRVSITDNELQIRIDNHTSWREAYLQASLNRDADLILAWLDDLSIFWTPEYTALKKYNDQQRQELVFELLPTLSVKQRQHAQEYVEDWIEILQDVLPEE